MITQNKNTTKMRKTIKSGKLRYQEPISLCKSLKIRKFKVNLPNSKLTRINLTKTMVPLLDKINKRISSQEKRLERFPTPKTPRPTKSRNNLPFNRVARKPPKRNIATMSVLCTRNNTLLTLSRSRGKVLKAGWASAGSVGFKNGRKSTLYASQAAAKSIVTLARQQGIRGLYVKLHGLGRAKSAVVRILNQSLLKIWAIRECTPAVHNGCRSPKSRRI